MRLAPRGYNQLALITGGARGIGFAIAEALLADGYHVVVTGLSDDEVAAVPMHERLSAYQLDVTNDNSVQEILSKCDRLDALINCAGMIIRGGGEYDLDIFKKVIDVNLTGTMCMCVAARKKLAESGHGVVINTASVDFHLELSRFSE